MGIFDAVFESNLVNLVLLDGGLFYFLKGSFDDNLSIRQKEILELIQGSEEKLRESKNKQEDSLKFLAETQLLAKSIRNEAESTIKKLETTILVNGQDDIDRFKTRARAQVPLMEATMVVDVANSYVATAVGNSIEELEHFMFLSPKGLKDLEFLALEEGLVMRSSKNSSGSRSTPSGAYSDLVSFQNEIMSFSADQSEEGAERVDNSSKEFSPKGPLEVIRQMWRGISLTPLDQRVLTRQELFLGQELSNFFWGSPSGENE
jgi:F0F1-type ATP synthase membrane subunit b/b'